MYERTYRRGDVALRERSGTRGKTFVWGAAFDELQPGLELEGLGGGQAVSRVGETALTGHTPERMKGADS